VLVLDVGLGWQVRFGINIYSWTSGASVGAAAGPMREIEYAIADLSLLQALEP
jgi:hypothetical protein